MSSHRLSSRRIALIDPKLGQSLDIPVAGLNVPAVFENPETLNQLCVMSGGHVRNLMQLIRTALDWTDQLPISAKAVQRAIEEARETYRNTILEEQWQILAKACHVKQADNNEQHLRLFLNRCLLEYRYTDSSGKLRRWCNVHPLIEEIEQFQDALAKVSTSQP